MQKEVGKTLKEEARENTEMELMRLKETARILQRNLTQGNNMI